MLRRGRERSLQQAVLSLANNPQKARDSLGDHYYLIPNNKALLNPWSTNPRLCFQLLQTPTCPVHQLALMHRAGTKQEQPHKVLLADLESTTNCYVISISNYLRLWLFPFKLLEKIFSSKLQNSCQLLFVEGIWAARRKEGKGVLSCSDRIATAQNHTKVFPNWSKE